jgi:hypothetical protein
LTNRKGEVFACGPVDDIREALKTLRRERVRQLPFVAAVTAGRHGIRGQPGLDDAVTVRRVVKFRVR